MGQDNGKHFWPWWKEKITSKWENDSLRFKMEKSFEEAIFNDERYRPMSWFLKQKDRLTALHPDMSEAMCTSQHFIFGNGYLNINGIDINNHKDRYFTIGENKRQKVSFPVEKKDITVIGQVINVNKEKYLSVQLIEAQISPSLTLEMKEDLIENLFQYREAFASDNEPPGAIKGQEVDIMLHVERP
ncbi:hypothetical protein O181_016012 [Austropuccinia psidii MF-1]|uniref:Uncharacterized protein n=1 Tax=Austropuccinia psidii MF-1 TaxID=1389203 RepID=A0A9Q3C4S1_9BASI|nr:hypothetical protein [Austropuccinia psidii MF-1]